MMQGESIMRLSGLHHRHLCGHVHLFAKDLSAWTP